MSNVRAFTMPKWGIEMTEGTIAEWMVAEGNAFTKGQVLCLIETSKITNEVEAEFDAVLKRIVVPAGEDAEPVGALLAVFADAETTAAEIDAFIADFKPAGEAAKRQPSPVPQPAPVPAPQSKPSPIKIDTNRAISPEALAFAQENAVEIDAIEGSGRGGRITLQDVMQAALPQPHRQTGGPLPLPSEPAKVFASPLATRLAGMHGIALEGVVGTGPRGRICKADVMALTVPADPSRDALPAPVNNAPCIVKMDRIRAIVARRLTESKQEIPHFYLRADMRVDALLELRRTANLVLGCKASINDYLVRAVALALVQHRDVNIHVHGQEIHQFPHADVAIAVASPKGLVTPIVRAADRLRVDQIAQVTRQLIERASAGRLALEDMSGGTFSVSNLGMFGIDQFDAIINPPQGAILAVGGLRKVAAEKQDGGIHFENRMQLSLSCDHRAIDGAAGALFMQTLRNLVEQPEGLFA